MKTNEPFEEKKPFFLDLTKINKTWFTPAEQEPPKDRPFLAKNRNGMFVVEFHDVFEGKPFCYYNKVQGLHYSLNCIDEWCEIPQDDK